MASVVAPQDGGTPSRCSRLASRISHSPLARRPGGVKKGPHPERDARVEGLAGRRYPVAMKHAGDPSAMTGSFDADGYAVLPALVSEALLDIAGAALSGRAAVGARDLLHQAWCADLAGHLQADARLGHALPRTHVAVQCTAFEKSIERNWLVPVHQDLAIPVAARVAHPALAGWSNKDGTWFVQPPVDVLEQLVAVRLHIDNCGADDGPLNVVAGSHRHGRIVEAEAVAMRNARGSAACPVPRGGAMLMRPLLLHASSKATGTSRRRVLHFLFGPPQLPFGLAWALAR